MDTEKMIKRIQLLSLSCDLKTEEGIRHFHCGHEYVEIGGLKWATMNIGAEKPTDCGLYFQWGDIQGYTADQVGRSVEGKKYFDWRDYTYGNGTSSLDGSNMTKYNDTDGKTVLDLEDDAVRYHWGGSWRMPTIEEMKSFRDAVNTEWITNYNGSGVTGVVCTDKNDSSKVLFFPSAGFASGGGMGEVGSSGYYWSSSLSTFCVTGSKNLCFRGGDCNITIYDFWRCYGFSVRGIFQ